MMALEVAVTKRLSQNVVRSFISTPIAYYEMQNEGRLWFFFKMSSNSHTLMSCSKHIAKPEESDWLYSSMVADICLKVR